MLPVRDGVGASQVGLPEGPWASMLDFLVQRFPAIPAAQWRERMAQGNVVDDAGRSVTPHQPYAAHGKLYYYRTVPDEAPNAAQATVLFEDELLVVADKPHFLPVTPSGNYLQETLLVRLRRQLGIDALTPLHRLDRETAGVVLLAKQPATCGHYHQLFSNRGMTKTYEAIAPSPDGTALRFPLTRVSALVEADHFMQMREAPGDAAGTSHAHTDIEWIETQGAHARYRLRPLTGRRHQLRVHMAALGLPIVGDRIYPTLLPEVPLGQVEDYSQPLQLLARELRFKDPLTSEERCFRSQRQLTLA